MESSAAVHQGELDEGTGTWESVEIDTGISMSGLRLYATTAGNIVILVTGSDGSGNGIVKAYEDTDADGLVEPTAATVVVSAADGLGLISGATWIDGASGRAFYIFDRPNSRVYRIVDTDSDEVPDDLGSSFATAVQFPELAGLQGLTTTMSAGAEVVTVSSRSQYYRSFGVVFDHSWVQLADTNGDGTADWSSGLRAFQDTVHFPPSFVDGVFHNKTQLLVHAPKGNTVEVYAQDSGGAFSEFLGTAVTGSNQRALVILNRQIGMNDVLRPVDTTLDLDGPAVEADNAEARLDHLDVREGTEDGGTTVTIYGEALPTTPNAHVWFGDSEATILSQASTQIVVRSNAAPQVAFGYDVVPVRIVCPGQPDATGLEFTFVDEALLAGD